MRLCRAEIRRSKAQLEISLASAIKDNKKCFYKYVSSKRKTRESLHSLLDAEGNMVINDEEKAEVLNAFLPQSLVARLVVLRESSLLSQKTETGRTTPPHSRRRQSVTYCIA